MAHNTAIAGGAGAAAGALGAIALGISGGPIGWAALIAGAVATAIGASVTAAVGDSNDEEALALEKLAHEYEINGNSRFASDSEFKKLLSELNITDGKLIDSLTENRTATLELAKEMALNN
jgi:phage tail tape-measure protein